jgi:hypothetical protein
MGMQRYVLSSLLPKQSEIFFTQPLFISKPGPPSTLLSRNMYPLNSRHPPTTLYRSARHFPAPVVTRNNHFSVLTRFNLLAH